MSRMIFCSALSCAGPQHHDLDGAPQVHGAREHAVTGQFFDRRRFAGKVRFVRCGLAFDEFGIDREKRVWLHQQPHAGLQLLDWQFLLAAVAEHDRGLRRSVEQRANFALACAPSRKCSSAPENENRNSSTEPSPHSRSPLHPAPRRA
jgi:hypothetical protein